MSKRASPRHRSEELDAPRDRALRLVVVADTHSRPHPQSAALVAKAQPDAILHAGDIGDHQVIAGLREIAPTLAVRGNIDGRGPDLPDSIDVTVRRDAQVACKLLLTHIAVHGPKLRADAARLALAHDAGIVVCGHSHVPFIGRDRGLVVFNPGSIGPRRFLLPITFGVLAVGSESIELGHVDCESGEAWEP